MVWSRGRINGLRGTVNTRLTDTSSIRRTPLLDRHLVLVPAVFQSFYCNFTLYKTDISPRRTTDTSETFNGQFMLWKILQNENIGALNESKVQNVWYFVVLLQFLQFAECVLFRLYTTNPRSRERLITQWEIIPFLLLQCFSFSSFVRVKQTCIHCE